MAAVALLALAGCGGGMHDTPSGPKLEVRLGLERDQAGLSALAFRVNDPASKGYGGFLTLAQIAGRFGAKSHIRETVLDVLHKHGVTGHVDATGGFVEAGMTTKQAHELFGVKFVRRTLEDGLRTIEQRGQPKVPAALRGLVTEVVGLARSSRTAQSGAPPRPELVASECSAAKKASAAILKRYGIAALHARGLRGQGMTLAVTAVDAFDRQALTVWARCLGVSAPQVLATGHTTQAVSLRSDHELELDLDTVLAAAPRLALETVTFDPVAWAGEPFQDALERAQGPPDVISSSETYCERALSQADKNLADWVLAAAAAAGVTVVVASGDTGSSGCAPDEKRLAVQYPSSSPFVTAVGGTELVDGRESVWSDPPSGQAGGGGSSASVARPPYQHVAGTRRMLPDVAYAADPDAWPAIPVCNSSTGTCEWRSIGGTSASAPLFASGAALVKQALRRDGKVAPGLLNALMYRDATAAASDVTVGSNDLFRTGCCTARRGYDPASGWGAFDFARLAAAARAAAR